MARTRKKSRLHSLGTPVIDLSLIIVISLLTLGSIQTLIPDLELEELDWIEKDIEEHLTMDANSLEDLFVQLESEHATLKEELNDLALRAHIEYPLELDQSADSNEPMGLRALVAAYTDRVDALRRQLKDLKSGENDLQDLNEVLGDRDSEIEDLEKQHQEMAQEFDRLNAKLVKQERFRSRLAPPRDPNASRDEEIGTRWFHHGSLAGRLILLLEASRVYIMEPPYVKVYRRGSIECYEPRGSGLSLRDASADNSPLMQTVSRPAFRKDGWVLILVNRDSFASYRTLRDILRQKNIQVGWEPHTGKVVSFASNGQRSGPQSN